MARAGMSRPETMKHGPDVKDFKALGPYSHAVVANGFVFISAETPLKPGGPPGEFVGTTVGDQTRQALRNIETILKDLGLSLRDVVKTTVYLVNPADSKAMNEAYRESFPEEPPARSIARFGADVAGLLVAIDAVALYSPRAGE
jgi:2-iminobutanoate/2-iminopropanoate deaminase